MRSRVWFFSIIKFSASFRVAISGREYPGPAFVTGAIIETVACKVALFLLFPPVQAA
jgi:hypothetical protein